MSLFRRSEIREKLQAPLLGSTFSLASNYSGETITDTTALQLSAVMSCVGLLADSVASLPIKVFKTVDGKSVEIAPPLWLENPAPTVTKYELMHQTVVSMALQGNAYLVLDRSNGGGVISVTPCHPNFVNVYAKDYRERQYTVSLQTVDPYNMLHLRWWTPPQGVKGISPIDEQSTTLGLSLAMNRHLAQFYGEGGTPSSVLETDSDITPNQAQALRDSWTTSHNRHRRPAVLTNGLRWKPVTTSASDMQINETRDAQVNEIARIFRIPSYLINAKGDGQTYQNNESAGMHFVTWTLLPWLTRLENGFSSLLDKGEFIKFDTEGFLRADTLTRFKSHQVAIMTGFRTPNEARQSEGLQPYNGGDEFVMALPGAPMASPSNPAIPPVGVDTVSEDF